jgi:protein translocase SecG subunit
MSVLTLLEVIISSILIISILLQHRASGLSQTFGGAGTTFVQRRGAEKLLYQVSVVLSIAFFTLAVLDLYL